MRKLILKCALLLFIVGTILYLGGAAYKQTNTYRNLERTEQTEVFREMPEAVDIAVFGSSHGRADFKYPPEGRTYFNFSLSSQRPYYDLRLMREYQDHIRPGALVVLTVTPANPFSLEEESSFLQLQPRYYRILSPKNIVDVDLWNWLQVRCFPLLTEDFTKIAAAFLHPPELVPDTDQRNGYRQLSPEDVPAEQDRVRRNHIPPETFIFPEESPVMMDAYREMLALCREKGWRAVLVAPPYLADYLSCYDEYDSSFFTVLDRTMEGLCQEYGAKWLDYSHDPDFTERYDLYKDIDHLNLDGAAVFNERFFSDVQALGLLGRGLADADTSPHFAAVL